MFPFKIIHTWHIAQIAKYDNREHENMNDRSHPSRRGNHEWVLPRTRTVNYGIETIRYLGPKTWEKLPAEIKSQKSLASFIEKIKKWKPCKCECRLCTPYIDKLGYLSKQIKNVRDPQGK